VRRRLAERGMMRPAATAEAIVDALRQGLVALDASQRVVMANPAFCEMFQTDPTAIQGKSLFAIHDGVLDIPELRIVLEDSLPSGMPSAELEIRPTLPHVGKRVLRVRARRLHHVLLVIDDITERERQAEALRGSEARARAILNATADGIITTDLHGVITMWNPAAERIFGYTTDEALGRKVTMLMPSSQDSPQKSAIEHGDDHGGFIAWFRDAVPRIIGQTAREVVGRRKDGTRFALELAVSQFYDEKGLRFVGIVRDITQRRHADDDERQRLAELVRVHRVSLVSELGVSLAHEVSQPLAAIVNTLGACARNIREGKGTKKDLLHLVNRAINESLRASEIVRNLREMARGRPLQRQDLDLRALIERVIHLIARHRERHHIGLRLALGDEPLQIHGSAVELEQVILNILQNAIESILESRRSHREIAISLSKIADDKLVEVAVRDTGVGIPSSSMERLFEPLFTTKPSGIGMGLAISRSIVEAHGGRLWVAPGEHNPGATTVRLTVPLAPQTTRPGRTRRRNVA